MRITYTNLVEYLKDNNCNYYLTKDTQPKNHRRSDYGAAPKYQLFCINQNAGDRVVAKSNTLRDIAAHHIFRRATL